MEIHETWAPPLSHTALIFADLQSPLPTHPRSHGLVVCPPGFTTFHKDRGFLPWSDLSTGPPCRYRATPEEEGKGEICAKAESPPTFEPAVERSIVVNQEGMDKVRLVLASNSNEWGATVA